MCGIIGLISNTPLPNLEARLRAGTSALAHRGPDGEGFWSDPTATAAFGHRRLSILDLTNAAAQPMVSADGRHALTYNGEIYNYPELRERLHRSGIQQHSSGDTETLFHWLREFGQSRLRDLHGMYAFGLWDRDEHRLMLARDPLGIKPLYYARLHRDGHDVLVFASEVRALLATGLVSKQLSAEGLYGYLGWGAVQSPQTILAEVEELPPGHLLTATPAGEVRIERFWRPAYPASANSPVHTDPERLRDELQRAVQSHRISDVPVGAFLSGGIDSSAITALLALGGAHPRTLSVTFPDAPDLDESRLSGQVAAQYRTEHHQVAISAAESLELCQRALAAQDQPSADGINSYIVAYAAHQTGLKVALSGLGGDELFAGYPSFRDVPATARWLHRAGPMGQALLAAGLELPLRLRPFQRHLQKLHQLAHSPRSLLGAYRMRRRVFSDRQIAQLVNGDISTNQSVWQEWEEETQAWAEADVISWLETRGYMGNMLLRDTDAMGMAHGLEIRVPFLHQPLLEWVQAQGPAMRRTSPHPKQALLDAVQELIPEECWNRPKQGFTLPFQSWLMGPLRPTVEELLMNPPASIFSKAFLRSLWQAWLWRPDQVGWARVWSLYVLLQWITHHSAEFEG